MTIERKKRFFAPGPDPARRMRPATNWADEIRRVWDKGDNTLELARVVHAARQGLRRGQWTELWRCTRMPFCKKKAEILVAIHGGLQWIADNAQISARLPRARSTRYYLAWLERTHLQRLVQEGVVHPRLKLTEAKEFAGLGGGLAGESKHPPVLRRLQRLEDFVFSVCQAARPLSPFCRSNALLLNER